MSRTILLVSQNPRLQARNALLLAGAGYQTMRTTNLTSAIQLAAHCQMSLIDHSFRPGQQDAFMERVHERNPGVFVMCLRQEPGDAQTLLRAVTDCFSARPGRSRSCVFGLSNVIEWPRKAS